MNLIVFDIDDTLTCSENQHIDAYTSAMRHFGIHEINENWKSYTHHTDSYILRINFENNLDEFFSLSFIESFEKVMTEKMKISKPVAEIKGAANFVNYLREEKGYAVAFATGSLLKPALMKLEQAGIWHHPALVASSNQTYDREGIVKDAVERAKAFYKVDQFDHIISIGDGLWDLKTAQNLGVHFIGVGRKNKADFDQFQLKTYTENWSNFDFEATEKAFKIA